MGSGLGITYNEARDGDRIRLQRQKVWEVVRHGEWVTLEQLERATGSPQASVSARLRDLRKPKYGGHIIERRYVDRGLWQYRYVAPAPTQLTMEVE